LGEHGGEPAHAVGGGPRDGPPSLLRCAPAATVLGAASALSALVFGLWLVQQAAFVLLVTARPRVSRAASAGGRSPPERERVERGLETPAGLGQSRGVAEAGATDGGCSNGSDHDPSADPSGSDLCSDASSDSTVGLLAEGAEGASGRWAADCRLRCLERPLCPRSWASQRRQLLGAGRG
jgi:hypothetical protein